MIAAKLTGILRGEGEILKGHWRLGDWEIEGVEISE